MEIETFIKYFVGTLAIIFCIAIGYVIGATFG